MDKAQGRVKSLFRNGDLCYSKHALIFEFNSFGSIGKYLWKPIRKGGGPMLRYADSKTEKHRGDTQKKNRSGKNQYAGGSAALRSPSSRGFNPVEVHTLLRTRVYLKISHWQNLTDRPF